MLKHKKSTFLKIVILANQFTLTSLTVSFLLQKERQRE